MLPIIKISCLPEDTMVNDDYLRLKQVVVEAVVGIPQLRYKNKPQVICLCPTDHIKYPPGSDIIVEIGGILNKPRLTETTRQILTNVVGRAVHSFFPEVVVICFITASYTTSESWTSAVDTEEADESSIDGILDYPIPHGVQLQKTDIPVAVEDWERILALPEIEERDTSFIGKLRECGEKGLRNEYAKESAQRLNALLRKKQFLFGVRPTELRPYKFKRPAGEIIPMKMFRLCLPP